MLQSPSEPLASDFANRIAHGAALPSGRQGAGDVRRVVVNGDLVAASREPRATLHVRECQGFLARGKLA